MPSEILLAVWHDAMQSHGFSSARLARTILRQSDEVKMRSTRGNAFVMATAAQARAISTDIEPKFPIENITL